MPSEAPQSFDVVDRPQSTMGIIVASRGEGGNIASMEARLAKVEAAVEHIERTVGETRGDIREMRRWLGGGFILLASAGIAACLLLDTKIEKVETRLTKIETTLASIDAKLDTIAPRPGATKAAFNPRP